MCVFFPQQNNLPTEILCPAEETLASLKDEQMTLREKLTSNKGKPGDHRKWTSVMSYKLKMRQRWHSVLLHRGNIVHLA